MLDHYESNHYLYDSLGNFHRLYVESCGCILNLDMRQVTDLFSAGVSHNLKKAKFDPELLRYTQSGLSDAVLQVDSVVQEVSSKLYGNASEASLEMAHDVSVLFKGESVVDYDQVQELVYGLTRLLDADEDDFIARLILAWLYFHYLYDLPNACQHFEIISIKAEEQNNNALAVLALRYYACSLALQGLYSEAYSAQYRAVQLNNVTSPQLDYELAQYALYDEQLVEQWKPKVRSFIKDNTFNYLLCQSNAYINEVPEVSQLLARFHKAKLEEIRDLTWADWNNQQPEALRVLVEGNAEEPSLMESTFTEHIELLSYQPYVVLYHTDKIKDKLLNNLNKKTKKIYKSTDENLQEKIERKVAAYKWVNKVGIILVYAAAIVSLSFAFLYLENNIFNLFPDSQFVNWSLWLPYLLVVIFGMIFMGVVLMRFRPSGVNRMVRERHLIEEALVE